MATLLVNLFTANLDDFTPVTASGTITAGPDGADHDKSASSWGTLGLYMTNGIVVAGGHVIYFKYKFVTAAQCHFMALLRDTTGITHTVDGTIRDGFYSEAASGASRGRTWDGSIAGGSSFNFAQNTFYDIKIEIDNSTGNMIVSAKEEASGSYTTIGTIAKDYRGETLRFATNAHTGGTGYNYYIKDFYWTDDGTISNESRSLNESVTISDGITRSVSAPRSLSESVTISDAISRSVAAPRGLSEFAGNSTAGQDGIQGYLWSLKNLVNVQNDTFDTESDDFSFDSGIFDPFLGDSGYWADSDLNGSVQIFESLVEDNFDSGPGIWTDVNTTGNTIIFVDGKKKFERTDGSPSWDSFGQISTAINVRPGMEILFDLEKDTNSSNVQFGLVPTASLSLATVVGFSNGNAYQGFGFGGGTADNEPFAVPSGFVHTYKITILADGRARMSYRPFGEDEFFFAGTSSYSVVGTRYFILNIFDTISGGAPGFFISADNYLQIESSKVFSKTSDGWNETGHRVIDKADSRQNMVFEKTVSLSALENASVNLQRLNQINMETGWAFRFTDSGNIELLYDGSVLDTVTYTASEKYNLKWVLKESGQVEYWIRSLVDYPRDTRLFVSSNRNPISNADDLRVSATLFGNGADLYIHEYRNTDVEAGWTDVLSYNATTKPLTQVIGTEKVFTKDADSGLANVHGAYRSISHMEIGSEVSLDVRLGDFTLDNDNELHVQLRDTPGIGGSSDPRGFGFFFSYSVGNAQFQLFWEGGTQVLANPIVYSDDTYTLSFLMSEDGLIEGYIQGGSEFPTKTLIGNSTPGTHTTDIDSELFLHVDVGNLRTNGTALVAISDYNRTTLDWLHFELSPGNQIIDSDFVKNFSDSPGGGGFNSLGVLSTDPIGVVPEMVISMDVLVDNTNPGDSNFFIVGIQKDGVALDVLDDSEDFGALFSNGSGGSGVSVNGLGPIGTPTSLSTNQEDWYGGVRYTVRIYIDDTGQARVMVQGGLLIDETLLGIHPPILIGEYLRSVLNVNNVDNDGAFLDNYRVTRTKRDLSVSLNETIQTLDDVRQFENLVCIDVENFNSDLSGWNEEETDGVVDLDSGLLRITRNVTSSWDDLGLVRDQAYEGRAGQKWEIDFRTDSTNIEVLIGLTQQATLDRTVETGIFFDDDGNVYLRDQGVVLGAGLPYVQDEYYRIVLQEDGTGAVEAKIQGGSYISETTIATSNTTGFDISTDFFYFAINARKIDSNSGTEYIYFENYEMCRPFGNVSKSLSEPSVFFKDRVGQSKGVFFKSDLSSIVTNNAQIRLLETVRDSGTIAVSRRETTGALKTLRFIPGTTTGSPNTSGLGSLPVVPGSQGWILDDSPTGVLLRGSWEMKLMVSDGNPSGQIRIHASLFKVSANTTSVSLVQKIGITQVSAPFTPTATPTQYTLTWDQSEAGEHFLDVNEFIYVEVFIEEISHPTSFQGLTKMGLDNGSLTLFSQLQYPGVTDEATYSRSLDPEVLVFSDAVVRTLGLNRGLAENSSVSDTLTKSIGFNRAFAESMTVIDSEVLGLVNTLLENIGPVLGSLDRLVNNSRSLTETVTISDTIAASASTGREFIEILNVRAEVTAYINRPPRKQLVDGISKRKLDGLFAARHPLQGK